MLTNGSFVFSPFPWTLALILSGMLLMKLCINIVARILPSLHGFSFHLFNVREFHLVEIALHETSDILDLVFCHSSNTILSSWHRSSVYADVYFRSLSFWKTHSFSYKSYVVSDRNPFRIQTYNWAAGAPFDENSGLCIGRSAKNRFIALPVPFPDKQLCWNWPYGFFSCGRCKSMDFQWKFMMYKTPVQKLADSFLYLSAAQVT